MSNLVLYNNSEIVVKDNLVVGKLPQVSTDEIIIYNKKFTEKKLSEITNSHKKDLAEIDKAISQWAYGLGINIEAKEIMILNDFIRENFGNLNVFDLKACVKLVVTDSELLKNDAEHYGKLTMNYVSKVLKSYLHFKNSSVFKVREEITKLQQLNTPKISNEERFENFKILLKNAYDVSKDFKTMYTDSGGVLYLFIKHNRLMNIVAPNIDRMLISEALDYANKSYEKKKKTSSMQSIIKDVSFSKFKKEEIIKREAQIYVVNKWLRTTDIETFVNNLTLPMLDY